MRRIGLAVLVGLGLTLASLAAEAQPAGKVYRIGYLADYSPADFPARQEGFRQGLRDLGYIDGGNIVIEYRYAHGKLERLPTLAAELVRLNVDLIHTAGDFG